MCALSNLHRSSNLLFPSPNTLETHRKTTGSHASHKEGISTAYVADFLEAEGLDRESIRPPTFPEQAPAQPIQELPHLALRMAEGANERNVRCLKELCDEGSFGSQRDQRAPDETPFGVTGVREAPPGEGICSTCPVGPQWQLDMLEACEAEPPSTLEAAEGFNAGMRLFSEGATRLVLGRRGPQAVSEEGSATTVQPVRLGFDGTDMLAKRGADNSTHELLNGHTCGALHPNLPNLDDPNGKVEIELQVAYTACMHGLVKAEAHLQAVQQQAPAATSLSGDALAGHLKPLIEFVHANQALPHKRLLDLKSKHSKRIVLYAKKNRAKNKPEGSLSHQQQGELNSIMGEIAEASGLPVQLREFRASAARVGIAWAGSADVGAEDVSVQDTEEEDALSMWQDFVVHARRVFQQLVDAKRIPATHLITFRLQGARMHASVPVARYRIATLSCAAYGAIAGEIRRLVWEMSSGRVVVAMVAYDGEHTKMREGESVPTTQLQLARQSHARALCIATDAKRRATADIPVLKGRDASTVTTEAANKLRREKQVKTQLVEAILTVLPPSPPMRRPLECGVLRTPASQSVITTSAPPSNATATVAAAPPSNANNPIAAAAPFAATVAAAPPSTATVAAAPPSTTSTCNAALPSATSVSAAAVVPSASAASSCISVSCVTSFPSLPYSSLSDEIFASRFIADFKMDLAAGAGVPASAVLVVRYLLQGEVQVKAEVTFGGLSATVAASDFAYNLQTHAPTSILPSLACAYGTMSVSSVVLLKPVDDPATAVRSHTIRHSACIAGS